MSPDDGLYSPTNWKLHQTREPRGLPPSGGKSAANFHVSRAALRAHGRAVQGQGALPLAPSGGNSAAKLHALEQPCAPMGAQSGVKGHCPLRRGSPPASEVGGTDAFAGKEGLAAAAQNDPARFHDETVVRRPERRVGVLLNEQDRDAAGP